MVGKNSLHTSVPISHLLSFDYVLARHLVAKHLFGPMPHLLADPWPTPSLCRAIFFFLDPQRFPILQSLHWLPIKFCISYKILLLAYKALNDLAPAYLTNLLSRYNPTRSLRSQNSGLLVVPRIAKSTKGGRTFSYLAPKLWNSLPDSVRGSDTLSLFKSRLKTHLFSQAFI